MANLSNSNPNQSQRIYGIVGKDYYDRFNCSHVWLDAAKSVCSVCGPRSTALLILPKPGKTRIILPSVRSNELFECSNLAGRTRKFSQRLVAPTDLLIPAKPKLPDERWQPLNLKFAFLSLSDEEAHSVPALDYPELIALVGRFQVINDRTTDNISLPCGVIRGNTFGAGQDRDICLDCGQEGNGPNSGQCKHALIDKIHTPGPQVAPLQRVLYAYEESTWPAASNRKISSLATNYISSATCQCSGCLADHPGRKLTVAAPPRNQRWFADLFGPFLTPHHNKIDAHTIVAQSTELHHRVYGRVEAFASASPRFQPRLAMRQSDCADALLFKLANGAEKVLIVNGEFFLDSATRLREVLDTFSGQTFDDRHKPVTYAQWRRKRSVHKAEQVFGTSSDPARVSCNKPSCTNNPLCPHALSEEALWLDSQAHRTSVWRKSTPCSPRLNDPVGFVPAVLRYNLYCFGKRDRAPTDAQMRRQFNPDGSLRLRMADVYGKAEFGAHQNADIDVSEFEAVNWEFSDSSRGTDWNDTDARLSELEKAGTLDNVEALLNLALGPDDRFAPDTSLPPFYATTKYSNPLDLASRQKLLKHKKLLACARALIQLGTWSKRQACLDNRCQCCILNRRCPEVFTEDATAGTSWKSMKSISAVAKRLRRTYSQARDAKNAITRMIDTYFGKWLHSTYGRPLPRDNSDYYLQLLSRLLASYRTSAGAPTEVIDAIDQHLPADLQRLGYQGERLFQEVAAECRTVLAVIDDLPSPCNCGLYHHRYEATTHCTNTKNRGWPVRKNR